jgi:hypothetical protein
MPTRPTTGILTPRKVTIRCQLVVPSSSSDDALVMVDLWLCKVSSEIHINGRCVSEPVSEDKGKMMATDPEDEKDLKRARLVLSKGREVVGPGYSRLIGTAAKVTDRGDQVN